ncbi:hypothetical protein GGR52DRAFT_544342 [Hypoxylon sp. FL1284]|nr:hypothetical protein GGR52DRAFT_544342 [Hypoxylon sp. FL1284]
MPPDDILTDDYVTDLLVNEANDCSLKYSSMGLDAFKSNKRPSHQPKPNTRFLNNIIRNTNSHNRALQARESAESKAKLRDLEDAEEKKRIEEERKLRKAKPGPGDTRKRMLGDIAAILGGSSKKRKTGDADLSSNASHAAKRGAEGSSRPQRKTVAVDDDRNDDGNDDGDAKSHGNRRKDRSSESSRTSRHAHRQEREGPERESSSSHSLGRKHRDRSLRRKSEGGSGHRRLHATKQPGREDFPSEDLSDSDPLDDIIGPLPANKPAKPSVQRRGRGASSVTSGIDSRFAPDYDPKSDTTLKPDDGDGWDRAAEAFRDRQKWKQRGADRLRSAGFTEEQVKQWQKDDQKNEADVRWIKAGAEREWDRGKVAGAETSASPVTDAAE